MAQIIIRQLPDEVHRALKAQARDHGRSAEAEARAILAKSLNGDERPKAGDMIAEQMRNFAYLIGDRETGDAVIAAALGGISPQLAAWAMALLFALDRRDMRDEVIAGGEVTSGKVAAGMQARVLRKGQEIAEVEVIRVQRQQQEAKEVFEGEMCGLSLRTNKKVLLEEGDTVEFFSREVVQRTL